MIKGHGYMWSGDRVLKHDFQVNQKRVFRQHWKHAMHLSLFIFLKKKDQRKRYIEHAPLKMAM